MKDLVQQARELRVVDARALHGPNRWSDEPLAVAEVEAGGLRSVAPRDVAQIVAGLRELAQHPALDNVDATTPIDVTSSLDSWGALVLHVTRELHRMVGARVRGRVLTSSVEEGTWTIGITFEADRFAIDAIHEATRIIRDLLRGDDLELDETVSDLARAYARGRAAGDVIGLITEARRRGIPARRNADDYVIELGHGIARRRVSDADAARESAVATLDRLYPDDAPVRIPIVAVTGTNGKTTTTRLVAHLFRTAGRRVGYTTTDGVYVDNAVIEKGDLTGPYAASLVLSNPTIEVAVLETARGGILRAGLGFDECDVGVVTNVTSDHLGLRGIETIDQLAEVKGVIPRVVRTGGAAVLNADDPLVAAMHGSTRGRVVYFSLRSPGEAAIADAHLASGGTVARVEPDADGTERLVIRDGADGLVELGEPAEIPLTFGGLARFQLGNVLAAASAAHALGLSAKHIRRGLSTFRPSETLTPGRLNVFETTRGRVMLDYAHNAAAIGGLVDFLKATPATRRMALLSAPGDRRDEDLRATAAQAVGLDLVILKEHEVYRRGREPGAINTIMRDGLLAAGQPDDRVLTFVEEHDAVAHLLSIMEPGDVAAIIADDTPGVMRLLEPYLPR